MDRHVLDLWRRAARHLARKVYATGDDRPGMANQSRLTRLPRDNPEWFEGRWTDETSRLVGSKGGDGVEGVLLRLSHAVAADDPGAVRPADGPWLLDALENMPGTESFREGLAALVREAEVGPPPAAGTVPEAFPFAYLDQERRGSGSMRVVRTGVGTMRDLGTEPCRVVARLRTDDGHEVVLRNVDGVPYRAVCRPGSWEGVGVAEFLAAARDGRHWRDNPFTGSRAQGVHEVAGPPRRDPDGSVDSEAYRECLDRAGHLVVIDGVVHVPTGSPMIHIETDSRHHEPPKGRIVPLRWSWSLACGLTSESTQTALWLGNGRSARAEDLWLDGYQPMTSGRTRTWAVGDGLGRGSKPLCLSFLIGDVEHAVGVADALSGTDVGKASGFDVRFSAPPSPDASHDPDFFAEDPLATVRALSSLAVRCYDPRTMNFYEPPCMTGLRHALRDGADPRDVGDALAQVERADLKAVARVLPKDHSRGVAVHLMAALTRAARETYDRVPEPDDLSALAL